MDTEDKNHTTTELELVVAFNKMLALVEERSKFDASAPEWASLNRLVNEAKEDWNKKKLANQFFLRLEANPISEAP